MRLNRWVPLAVLSVALAACSEPRPPPPGTPAEAEQGRLLLQQFGCSNCHHIPGVAGATGRVGPPLEGIGRRAYLAGVLPNTPDNMVAWIRAPQEIDPLTAMPDLQVTEPHARAMTAYLYRLR